MDLSFLQNNSPQIILFRDRIHYKKKNKFHNVMGPAVKPLKNSNVQPEYYIRGEKLSYKEWMSKSKAIKRKAKLNKIKEKKKQNKN